MREEERGPINERCIIRDVSLSRGNAIRIYGKAYFPEASLSSARAPDFDYCVCARVGCRETAHFICSYIHVNAI